MSETITNPQESQCHFSGADLAALCESAPVALCFIEAGEKACILDANKSFLALLNGNGLNRDPGFVPLDAANIRGRPVFEYLDMRAIEPLCTALSQSRPSQWHDVMLSDSDADEENKRWARLSVFPALFEGKKAFSLWAVDVTQNKQTEARLKLAVDEADALSEMKSQFLATMSHEIRTPMQTIFGLLELIAELKPTQDILDMVSTARTAASGLLEILDDILDLAKVDAGKMELDNFEIPLRTLARGVLEGMSVKVAGKDIRLIDEIDQEVPFVVMGDPKRLRQVLLNLVGNAMKFTERGNITLRVNLKAKNVTPPENGLALRFEIQDSGIGMSEDVAARLFQPFTQADSSTTRKYGGTGLGLSICRSLLELMGGEIGVDSQEGVGSTFWFEIPTFAASTTTKVEMPKLDGIAVLSVEDHPQGSKEIESSLRSMGAEIISVGNCKDALEFVKRRPFDVAVIDQGLPDGLGIDLMKQIAEIRPYMGLIMYTVRDDYGMQQSVKIMGANYISKPASRRGLGEAVKAAAKQYAKIDLEGPKRLLIAEDTESVREVMRRQLNTLNVEVDFVVNGLKALEALKTGQYGILITDLHMPEMDGYGLIKTIRDQEKAQGENAKRKPVMALTADVQLAQKQAYLTHGFDECLLKPVSLGQLRRLLIRWGVLSETEEKAEPLPAVSPAAGQVNGRAAKKELLPTPEGPAIDRDAVIDQMGALDEGAVEMLGLFVEMTQPLIGKIKTAQDADDRDGLRELAHSLKGGARSACCAHLGNLAAKLQDRADNRSEDCDALVAAIVQEFGRVTEEINQIKPS